MNLPPLRFRLPAVLLLCCLAPGLLSCGKRNISKTPDEAKIGAVVPELLANKLAAHPGALYRSQAASPINWQPWTHETFERARDARRLLFCVVVMPQQPGFQERIGALAENPALTAIINDNYVPVLVDGDAAREMGILSAELCAEIRRGLSMPLFLWLTFDGNPVAWTPVATDDKRAVGELFNHCHTMVSRIWLDSPDYVLRNSATDNEQRRNRIIQRKSTRVMSPQPGIDALRSVRQLVSMYDPYTRTFDETGGLFPASAIELLAVSAAHPGLPEELRRQCREAIGELLVDLLPSAVFDPLEGGVFHSRMGSSWSLPSFHRDCISQARAAVALLDAYRATGSPRALDKAMGLIGYAEKFLATPDGMFALGLAVKTDPAAWMWSVEDVTRILGTKDAGWWIRAMNMQGLGNIPSEADPQREFFRNNTIGLDRTLAELAAQNSEPLETFAPRFESARARLLAERRRRLGEIPRDETAHAPSTFRMVSAYAAAFCATGDEDMRRKAVALLQRAREAFSSGPRLRVFAGGAPDPVNAGRAFHYALAMQAALDTAAITSDEQWILWSEDLATTSAELFTGEGLMKECPDGARVLDIPVTDLVMLFDDSTAGVVSQVECRLAQLGRPLVNEFSALATPLPTYTMGRPVLHTDLLAATVSRNFPVLVVHDGNPTPEMRLAIERLPMRMIHRREARPDETVPSGSVKVLIGGDAAGRIVTTPQALHEALLPLRGKSEILPAADAVTPSAETPDP